MAPAVLGKRRVADSSAIISLIWQTLSLTRQGLSLTQQALSLIRREHLLRVSPHLRLEQRNVRRRPRWDPRSIPSWRDPRGIGSEWLLRLEVVPKLGDALLELLDRLLRPTH